MTEKKPKPAWQLNLKWLTGILFVGLFATTLLLFNISWLTQEERAVDLLGGALAVVYSRNGLDDESEINQLRALVKTSGETTFQPVPGLNITITKEALDNKSPREIRLNFFRQLAGPLYQGGAEGLAQLATDQTIKENILEGVGPISLISAKTHQLVTKIFLVLAVVSGILGVLLIYFSQRLGRLFSPGLAIFLASLPGSIFFTLASLGLQNSKANQPPAPESGVMSLVGYLASQVLVEPIKTIAFYYQFIFFLGLGLMILAFLGKVSRRLYGKLKKPS